MRAATELVLSRADLGRHLVQTGIAGPVATSREINLAHYRRLAEGDRYYWLGFDFADRWSDEAAVLATMAQRCGVVADPDHLMGQDTISPDLTLAGLDRAAAVFGDFVRAGSRILLATGHPGALLDFYRCLAAGARSAGSEVARLPSGLQVAEGRLVQLCDVAMVEIDSTLPHTHSADPMNCVLTALRAEGRSPDLVIADHGWAGAAAQAGVPTIAIADCNDPALFLAEVECPHLLTIPLDDHVLDPRSYDPLASYLLHGAGLTDS